MSGALTLPNYFLLTEMRMHTSDAHVSARFAFRGLQGIECTAPRTQRCLECTHIKLDLLSCRVQFESVSFLKCKTLSIHPPSPPSLCPFLCPLCICVSLFVFLCLSFFDAHKNMIARPGSSVGDGRPGVCKVEFSFQFSGFSAY